MFINFQSFIEVGYVKNIQMFESQRDETTKFTSFVMNYFMI